MQLKDGWQKSEKRESTKEAKEKKAEAKGFHLQQNPERGLAFLRGNIVNWQKKLYRFTCYKDGWLLRHPRIRLVKLSFQKVEWHYNRGMGFFNTYIDLMWKWVKLLLGFAAIKVFFPSIPNAYFLIPALIVLIIAIPFCLFWSFVIMDMLRWTEDRNEMSNVRNYFIIETRKLLKKLTKKP